MKRLMTLFIAALAAITAAFAEPNYRCTFTFSGYTGSAALGDFPVLVKFAADKPKGFAYSQFQPGQTDLAFWDENNNRLPYEIDTWNPEGTSAVWVKLPALTATTKLVATWGDPSVTTVPAERAKGSVWTAGYAGVWHMSESAAGDSAVDATLNGLDAAPGGTTPSQMVGSADAAVGTSRVIASSATANKFSVPNYDSLSLGDTFTVGAWLKASSFATNVRIFRRKI